MQQFPVAAESVPGLNTDLTSQRKEKKNPLGRPPSDQNRTKANRTEIPRAHFLAVGEKRHSSLFLPNRSHIVRVPPPAAYNTQFSARPQPELSSKSSESEPPAAIAH